MVQPRDEVDEVRKHRGGSRVAAESARPATGPGRRVGESFEREARDLVTAHPSAVLEEPMLVVGTVQVGEARTLAVRALDAALRHVVVDVAAELNAATLVRGLALAQTLSRVSLASLAKGYPAGPAAFWRDAAHMSPCDGDQERQREGYPTGARLVLVCAAVDLQVQPAVDFLGRDDHPGLRVLVFGATDLERAKHRCADADVASPEPAPIVAASSVISTEEPSVITTELPMRSALPRTYLPLPQGGPHPGRSLAELSPALQAAVTGMPTGGSAAPRGGPVQRDLRTLCAEITDPLPLVWLRERRGERHEAVLHPTGVIELPGGARYRHPSMAAAAIVGIAARVDGWTVWHLGEHGPTLAEAWDELDGR